MSETATAATKAQTLGLQRWARILLWLVGLLLILAIYGVPVSFEPARGMWTQTWALLAVGVVVFAFPLSVLFLKLGDNENKFKKRFGWALVFLAILCSIATSAVLVAKINCWVAWYLNVDRKDVLGLLSSAFTVWGAGTAGLVLVAQVFASELSFVNIKAGLGKVIRENFLGQQETPGASLQTVGTGASDIGLGQHIGQFVVSGVQENLSAAETRIMSAIERTQIHPKDEHAAFTLVLDWLQNPTIKSIFIYGHYSALPGFWQDQAKRIVEVFEVAAKSTVSTVNFKVYGPGKKSIEQLVKSLLQPENEQSLKNMNSWSNINSALLLTGRDPDKFADAYMQTLYQQVQLLETPSPRMSVVLLHEPWGYLPISFLLAEDGAGNPVGAVFFGEIAQNGAGQTNNPVNVTVKPSINFTNNIPICALLQRVRMCIETLEGTSRLVLDKA